MVLPVYGGMEIEVGGRGGRLTQGVGAFVPRNTGHAQSSGAKNRFLVVDVSTGALDSASVERLSRNRFFAVTPAAEHLVQYMALALDGGGDEARSTHWLSLFLGAMETPVTGPKSRLSGLLEKLKSRPGRAWTVDEMAAIVGVSESRLYVLFRNAFDCTPHAWLAEQRMQAVRHGLSSTSMSIAEIAGMAGFSDQSALTRAFRQATNFTPAEYRKLQQELRSNKQ
ncbi:AraC family transcriptional regulator [Achromobacter aloeverae]|uniref:AraC family transcriptional regulator n=1 Tax=Achromobacter aloeverae TaxID=1750518 RepID=A0A4Q1HCY1_9BURK|nr:AraC family transcriptional regulator [Achromobacter aloeverae]